MRNELGGEEDCEDLRNGERKIYLRNGEEEVEKRKQSRKYTFMQNPNFELQARQTSERQKWRILPSPQANIMPKTLKEEERNKNVEKANGFPMFFYRERDAFFTSNVFFSSFPLAFLLLLLLRKCKKGIVL